MAAVESPRRKKNVCSRRAVPRPELPGVLGLEVRGDLVEGGLQALRPEVRRSLGVKFSGPQSGSNFLGFYLFWLPERNAWT